MITGIEPAWQANSGGPMSRSRTQLVLSSLLQGDRTSFSCCARLGVEFGEQDPLRVVRAALRAARVRDPEALRSRYELPAEPWMCREVPALVVPLVEDLSQDELLERSLLLGLATPWLLDPRRPVLFTRASLTRRLEVYTARGFYA